MEPLLSVVVPAYGVAEFLPDCLESLLNQTLTDLEIIVVDDGSPDECGEIADSYAQRDTRVRVLHTPNQGLGPARNNGAAVARGRYLAFVDSDDLVPPRAFALMVKTLETTGSDFAAGNAWRYLPGKGNLPSWTHRQAFAEDRFRTNIRRFPLLLRDRMAWNKVYRRSFWMKHELTFPAMRYEDYPVGMAAHLLADNVDILSTKVYLWRQRAGGGSITQQTASVDNVRDRVISAEMVLDIVEGDGDIELVDGIHAYLTDIDLISVAESFALADPSDSNEMWQLLLRLANRLKPLRRGTTRLSRLIHRAVRSGQVEAVRAMAKWRQGGRRGELFKEMARPRSALMLPALVSAVMPRQRNVSVTNRRLRCALTSGAVEDGKLRLDVAIKLRASLLRRSTVYAELLREERVLLRLPVNVAGLDGFRNAVVVEVDPLKVGDHLKAGPGKLRLCASLGPLRWHGDLDCDVELLPEPVADSDDSWLVASRHATQTGLWLSRTAAIRMGEIDMTPQGLEISLPGGEGFVGILRAAPSEPLLRSVVDGKVLFEWADIVDNDPPDNPANGESFRPIVHLQSSSLATAQRSARDAWEPEPDLPDTELPADELANAEETAEIEAEAADELQIDEPLLQPPLKLESAWPIYSRLDPKPFVAARHSFRLGKQRSGATELIIQHGDFL